MKPRPPFFPHFTDSGAAWPVAKPALADLANSALGNAALPSDGWDAALGQARAAVTAAGGKHKTIKQCLADFRAAVAAADKIPFADLDGAITAASSSGAPLVAAARASLALLAPAPSWFSNLPAPPIAPVAFVSSVGAPGAAASGQFTGASIDSAAITTGALALATHFIATGAITGALATALPVVIPVVGAAIAVALLAIQFLGGGCGQACIDGSKAEQIYEAAADNLLKAYKLGMISGAHALAGMVYLISAGTKHLEQFGTPEANRGIENMRATIQAEITDVNVTKPPKPVPLDLAKVRLDYVSGPGWYPDSLAAAATLTDTLLKHFAAMKG